MMGRETLLLAIAALLISLAGPSSGFFIWPEPSSMLRTNNTNLVLDPSSFQFVYSSNAGNHSDFMQNAFSRYQKLVFYQSSAHIRLPRDSQQLRQLIVTVNSSGGGNIIQFGADESYELGVDGSSTATLTSNTVFGALRGLETFSQLVDWISTSDKKEPKQQGYYIIQSVPINISDSPRFLHRGLLVDTSRHFLPISVLTRTIDALSYNKMNVLHWHVTDAESFPVQSTAFPNLSKGAWAPQYIYSQADIQSVVAYGLARGVRVLPEFDTPGHTASWGKGYPITANCPSWSANVNNVPLNPASSQMIPVVQGFFGEMTSIFVDDYFHIGGDEVVYSCWKQDTSLTAWMQKQGINSYNGVMQYYENFMWNLMTNKLNKKMIAWQEVFNEYGLTNLPKQNLIIEVWKDEPTLLSVAQAGLRGILAYGWYLDHPLDWKAFYNMEPFSSSSWTSQLQKLIVGGEAAAWGEMLNEENYDPTIWPRTSATAERLWSPKSVTNINYAQVRLIEQICRMNRRGIASGPIRPGFCPS